MPRWVKVVVWVAVFSACAAAGAYLASRTDPFPPGVEDPGARPSDAPSPPPIWKGAFTATTEHRLHVGGTCRSDWRATYRMTLRDDGTIRGDDGIAVVEPGSARCDFEQAQAQTRSVELAVTGTWVRRGQKLWLTLRFREVVRDPVGSLDVGGFLPTFEAVRPTLGPVSGAPFDELADTRHVRLPDGNEGTYEAEYRFHASCARGCP
jgi:hypothetical protein